MDVASFYYLEGGLLFGFVVAAGLTVVSLNTPNYRVARRCAWAAAILFGSIAVVWGVTTKEPTWIRIPAVGLAGLVATICLTEALRFIKNREFPLQQSAVATDTTSSSSDNKPFFEATNRSTIDAKNATFPEDLPFKQFAKADNDSLVNMQGLQVTKTEKGWEIKPGNGNIQFPEPPSDFAFMPSPELKRQMRELATKLRDIQREYAAATKEAYSGSDDSDREQKFRATLKKYTNIYLEQYADLAFSLSSAALQRTGSLTSTSSREFQTGGECVFYKKFVGPTPGSDIATFLDAIADRVPDR